MHARRYNTFHVQAATAADDSDRMRKVFESKAAGVRSILLLFCFFSFASNAAGVSGCLFF